jgi:hypothetical protein
MYIIPDTIVAFGQTRHNIILRFVQSPSTGITRGALVYSASEAQRFAGITQIMALYWNEGSGQDLTSRRRIRNIDHSTVMFRPLIKGLWRV